MSDRKVVVTGTSVTTALGSHVPDVWDRLRNGDSGLSLARSPHVSKSIGDAPSINRPAGQIRDFAPARLLSLNRRSLRRMDRFVQLAMLAAETAFHDSAPVLQYHTPQRCGAIIGSCFGGVSTIETQHERQHARGPERVSAFLIPSLMINAASGNIAVHWGMKGISYGLSATCASGIQAIGAAYRMVRSGQADMMLCGAAEAPLCDLVFAGLDAMACSSHHETSHRQRCVPAEGAGLLLLEDFDSAARRGAKVMAEVVGYGQSFGSVSTTTDPEGGLPGLGLSLQAALKDASCEASSVGHIMADAWRRDLCEADVEADITHVLGESAGQRTSDYQQQLGHAFGASGAINAALTVYAMHQKRLASNSNVLVCSSGFGGQNGVVCLSH